MKDDVTKRHKAAENEVAETRWRERGGGARGVSAAVGDARTTPF